MKVLKFIEQKKRSYELIRDDYKADMRIASKLGFITEFNKIEKERNDTMEILDLLDEISAELKKERVFSENEISQLQSAVHKITGDGEVMQCFNSLLGVAAGSGS